QTNFSTSDEKLEVLFFGEFEESTLPVRDWDLSATNSLIVAKCSVDKVLGWDCAIFGGSSVGISWVHATKVAAPKTDCCFAITKMTIAGYMPFKRINQRKS